MVIIDWSGARLTTIPSPAARRSSRSWSHASFSDSLPKATLRSLTRNLAALVGLAITEEERARALMCPTVGVILALRSHCFGFCGSQQLAVVILVLLKTTAVGLTRLTVNIVLVVVTVTRAGVTVFVGITVAEGRIVVNGGNVVVVVSVTETMFLLSKGLILSVQERKTNQWY